MKPTELPAIEDLDFGEQSVRKLYSTGLSGISSYRWERVREEIRFEDLLWELTGKRDSVISCPFHGRDSRPSFTVYNRSNDAYCFGCPPGKMYYDSLIFASKYMDISRRQALKWLEQKFDLPPLPIEENTSEEEEEEQSDLLSFYDLSEPFLRFANEKVIETKDVELAEDYIRIYFTSLSLLKEAEKPHDEEEKIDTDELRYTAALGLAQVLGKEKLIEIMHKRRL